MVCTNETPFDSYFADFTQNRDHVELWPAAVEWVKKEIKGELQPPMVKSIYTISRPNPLCSAATYNIPVLPAGTKVTWSATGGASIVGSINSNTVNVERNYNGNTAMLTATLTSGCGKLVSIKNLTLIEENAWFTSRTDYYGLYLSIPSQTGFTYQWHLNGVLVSTTNNYRIPYPSCGSGANTLFPIQLIVINTCGARRVLNQYYIYDCYPTSGLRFVYSTDGSGGLRTANNFDYTYYPNPANTQLTVSSSPTASKTNDVANSETIQTLDHNQFEIVLYDEKGKKLTQQKNDTQNKDIEINTQNIPNGIYFLHIFEGKEITIKQIVIQH